MKWRQMDVTKKKSGDENERRLERVEGGSLSFELNWGYC
jgi:hypothetical protein